MEIKSKGIERFKIRKNPSIEQINGVKLSTTISNKQPNGSQEQRLILLEKILRNKQQSGLVIYPTDDVPTVTTDTYPLEELDENVQYEPIEPVEPSEEEKTRNASTPEEPDQKTEPEINPPPPPAIPPFAPPTNEEQPTNAPNEVEPPLPTVPKDTAKSITKRTKKKIVIDNIPPLPVIPEENEKEPEQDNIPIPPKPTTKKPRKKIVIVDTSPRPIINLQNEMVERLPSTKASKTVILKTSRFYLNNRKMFLKNFDEIFKKYKKDIEESEKENVSCDSRNETRDLFVHQRIVRDYLNLHTPYRGLLLYHGLGSGKTCTSIAIAEGMKIPDKRIYILTPASLKMNYFSELKKCGDVLYKKKQYWEFVSIEGQPEYLTLLSNALSLPEDYITQNRGAWLVNVKKNSNFEMLTTDQQKQIDAQINKMIRAKYIDVNYNGMNYAKLEEMTDSYTINPFDNSVVVVDEAHNFVSRIVNSLKKMGRKQVMESSTPPKSISLALYQYLMSATNVRIVLLSGTPIINYPNEIAVLYNILRGYIKTWTFQVTVGEGFKGTRVTKDSIMEIFEKNRLKVFDYMEYSGNKLTITRNPFGFINSTKKPSATKKKVDATVGHLPVGTDTERPVEVAEGHGVGFDKKTIAPSKKNGTRKRTEVPAVQTPSVIAGGGVGDEYNGVYYDDPNEPEYDGQGNITDDEFERRILHILSKNGLYVSPNGVTVTNNKCLPDNEDDFFTTFVDMGDTKIINMDVFKRRILGLTSYFRSSQERLLPRFIPSLRTIERDGKQTSETTVFHMVYCTMSNYQFKKYIVIRESEIENEKNAKKQKMLNEKKGVFVENNTYRIYSRAVCNFAFPDPPGRPMPSNTSDMEQTTETQQEIQGETGVNNGTEGERDAEGIEEEEEVEGMDTQTKTNYFIRIKKAMKEINTPDFLSEESIAQYSPKFAEFLHIFGNGADSAQTTDNPVDTKGCHLLYSNFRTIEGIGILRLALLQNGYEEFKIRKSTTGIWEIVNDSTGDKTFSNTASFKRFVLYTGTETAEEKEVIRNIYNGDWELVPSSISTILRGVGYTDNMFGEVIRLFMITASGSEGINLKNTRFVHIMEPYWNLTRVEQIIGRASRICSHASLPEELRTVKVYMYVAVFNSEPTIEDELYTNTTGRKKSQIDIIKENVILSQKEGSRLNESTKLTTDESLLEISTIKNRINSQILKAVKETAIDCKLYNKSHASEGLTCYDGYGIVKTNNFGSFPSIQQDTGERMEQNVERVQLVLNKVTINKKPYKINLATKEVYEEVGEGRNKELVLVGVLKEDRDKNDKKRFRISPRK